MAVTLRDLLGVDRFRLRLLVAQDAADGAPPALDRPLAWAHSSDLPDPTPWLEPDGLLLTDGVHLVGADAATAEAYVARLVAARVRALGFATDVVHARVPAVLVDACARQGLPLVEVADRAPFMALIRHVSDALAHERQERLEWSLAAHRAVARAALRPDGLTAVLRELERRLGCWVALVDAAGRPVPVRTRRRPPPEALGAALDRARTMLARGLRASSTLPGDAPAADVTLQTLGAAGTPHGVLVVGTPAPLDPVGRDLVAGVIAIASIALEQSRGLLAARRRHAGDLLELLLAGAIDPAATLAPRDAGGPLAALPEPPVRLALVPAGGDAGGDAGTGDAGDDPVAAALELRDAAGDGGHLWARRPDGTLVVLLPAADAPEVVALLAPTGRPLGVSGPGGLAALPALLAEARRAAERAAALPTAPPAPGGRAVLFDAPTEGLLGLLAAAGGVEHARRRLAPLLAHPAADLLVPTVRAWLEAGLRADPAARALGVHRHTVTARVAQVEALLDVDLRRFAACAALWAELELAGAG
ncbi:PucR family transcriptional regulator [Cellulomonas endophytica]|uniref:PucR family transcriptional regulator n=1 Tax=Cellulomonas endophytica TaxID=2494735 RepID=UPI0013E91B59|nr:PucR family transcriptional regulator [Cellulomonas endophytica]